LILKLFQFQMDCDFLILGLWFRGYAQNSTQGVH
jgi:hypothetical protein